MGILDAREYKDLDELKDVYFNYKLTTSRQYIRIICLVVGLFNSLLLIPDLKYLAGPFAKLNVIFVRAIFTILLLGIFFFIKKIKTFKLFSSIITVCEIFAVLIFLFVLSQYTNPDFLIQTLGANILAIIVFFVPNHWRNMLAVAVLNAAGYLICSYVLIEDIDIMILGAVAVYLAVLIFLCASFALNTERHQFQEFAAKHKLNWLSSTDFLTKVANRYKLAEEADRWIKFCSRQKLPLSLVLIDVDDFKNVNDQYGHLAGDSVLVDLVKVVDRQSRSSDILARWGGEEFVLLLPNLDLENTVLVVERIRKSIEEFTFIEGIHVTCSFGVVEMKEILSFEDLIREADGMMYKGKEHGKNNIQWNS